MDNLLSYCCQNIVLGKSCLQSLLIKILNLTYFSGILMHILHRLMCDFIIWPNKMTKSCPIKTQIIVSIDVQTKGQLSVPQVSILSQMNIVKHLGILHWIIL